MFIRGFTLLELLITLAIAAIILALAIPGFSGLLHKTRTETAMQTFIDTIQKARSQAVLRNQRTMLVAEGKWHEGWMLFADLDNDGTRDTDEPVILENGPLEHIKIDDNFPVKDQNQLSFISTGEGRAPGKRNRGAMLIGSFRVCPKDHGDGIKLSLNRAGRLRSEKLSEDECKKI